MPAAKNRGKETLPAIEEAVRKVRFGMEPEAFPAAVLSTQPGDVRAPRCRPFLALI